MDQTPELHSAIARLEREVRWLWVFLICLAVTAVLVGSFALLVRGPMVVDVKELNLVDETGTLRATLSLVDNQPILGFFDPDENPRVALRSEGLSILDSRGKPQAELTVLEGLAGGPVFRMYGRKGEIGLSAGLAGPLNRPIFALNRGDLNLVLSETGFVVGSFEEGQRQYIPISLHVLDDGKPQLTLTDLRGKIARLSP